MNDLFAMKNFSWTGINEQAIMVMPRGNLEETMETRFEKLINVVKKYQL